ncbi:ATP-grasp domain-containing protein [Streptomyces venetus]|uniref:ATP-grasp domain-containing protein n=1 Tax=Streptomyces venetus TaxID=1701086 RepID=A0ABP8FHT9_9ACTN
MTDLPTPPSLLLVGGARPVSISVAMVLEALAQARARGLRTHVTGPAEALAATAQVGSAADAVSAVRFVPPEETADWARRQAAQGERFDAVFALQEMAQIATAQAAEAIGAPGNPPDAIRRIRTKDACRAALAAAGFAQPRVRLCAGLREAEAFLQESRGPWIVKPRDAMGSIGVSRVTGPDGLPAALELLPDTAPFLVEEFVEGPEFSVEGVFLGGAPRILAVTAKEKVAPPHFVEVGHVLPAELPDQDRRRIEQQVSSALTVLGLRTGAFHVELWLTPRGVVLGEVHGRFGGDWIHRMVEYAIPGLELFGLVYDDMLGRADGPGPLEPLRGAAVRYLTPPPGRLLAVHGWDAVRAHGAVLHAELTVSPGDVIHPLHRSSDRVGLVVVGADTAARAHQLALELTESVRFETDPVPAGTVPATHR